MKEANPKTIGLFVIGGVVLSIAALVLFSDQGLFTPKRYFVAYFQQSVNGLSVGAPVRLRGIPVGVVTRVDGVYHPLLGDMIPRLTLEIHPETLENAVLKDGQYTLFPSLLAHGIRARLASSSLLTGQLYVALDFYPETEERYLGEKKHDYPEMPTIDSGLDRVIARLSELPIQELIARAISTLDSVENIMRHPQIDEALTALPQLIRNTDSTVVSAKRVLDEELIPLLQEANRTLVVTRGSIDALASDISEETLVQLSSTLKEFESALLLLQKRLDRQDPLSRELITTLREMGVAFRSIKELADELEQNPEALVWGKVAQ